MSDALALRRQWQIFPGLRMCFGSIAILRCCATSFNPIFLSALISAPQNTFAVSLFIIVLTFVGVFLTFGEDRADQPYQLVRCSSDRL